LQILGDIDEDKAKPVVRRGRKATGPEKGWPGCLVNRGNPAFFLAIANNRERMNNFFSFNTQILNRENTNETFRN
jgi:hypothetical protein